MEVLGRNDIIQLLLRIILLTGQSWGDKHNSISLFTSRAPCYFLSSRNIADFKVIGYFWQKPEFKTGLKTSYFEARKRNTTMPGLSL